MISYDFYSFLFLPISGGSRDVHICELGNQRITKGALTVLTSHGYRPELRDLLSILQSLAISPSPAIASAKKAGPMGGPIGEPRP